MYKSLVKHLIQLKGLVLFIFIWTQSIAQDYSVKWSQPIKTNKNEYLGGLFYDDGKFIYVEKQIIEPAGKFTVKPERHARVGLMKFDHQMNLVLNGPYIDLKEEQKLRGIYYVGGRFVFIYSIIDKENQTIQKGINISLSTLAPYGSDLNFDSLYNISYNDTTFFKSLGSNNDTDSFICRVFDSQLNLLFDKSFPVPDSAYTLNYSSHINSDSTIFIAIRSNYSKEISKSFSVQGPDEMYLTNNLYKFNIYVAPKDKSPTKYQLGAKDDYSEGGKFISNEDGATIYFGKYQQYTSYYMYKYSLPENGGFALMEFEPDGKLNINTRIEFSSELLNDLNKYYKPQKRFMKMMFSYFDLSKIEIRNDKIFLIFSDDDVVNNMQQDYMGGLGGGAPATITSDEVVVLCTDLNGKELWHKIIPKRQEVDAKSMTDQYGKRRGASYFSQSMMSMDDKFLIFYNDLDENINISSTDKKPKKYNGSDKGKLFVTEIALNGESKKYVVSDNGNELKNICISYSKQVSQKQFFLYSYDRDTKEIKYGLMTVK